MCSLTRLAHRLGGNSLKVEGAQIMADLLKTNTTITSLECAATRPILCCQEPLTLKNVPALAVSKATIWLERLAT